MFSLKHATPKIRYFPGGPVVKIPYFHWKGYKLDGLGGELRSHMPYDVTKNKIKCKNQKKTMNFKKRGPWCCVKSILLVPLLSTPWSTRWTVLSIRASVILKLREVGKPWYKVGGSWERMNLPSPWPNCHQVRLNGNHHHQQTGEKKRNFLVFSTSTWSLTTI